MALAEVHLDDKYTLESGRIYISGVQALVRLPMMQRQRDLAAGLADQQHALELHAEREAAREQDTDRERHPERIGSQTRRRRETDRSRKGLEACDGHSALGGAVWLRRRHAAHPSIGRDIDPVAVPA